MTAVALADWLLSFFHEFAIYSCLFMLLLFVRNNRISYYVHQQSYVWRFGGEQFGMIFGVWLRCHPGMNDLFLVIIWICTEINGQTSTHSKIIYQFS